MVSSLSRQKIVGQEGCQLPFVENKRWVIANAAAWEPVACALLQQCTCHRLWLFSGPLGSGKTTLIATLCRQLGVEGAVISPTFTLLRSYAVPMGGAAIQHADLYRLEKEEELQNIGLQEHLYGPNYCFVEWADKFPTYWPQPHVWLRLAYLPTGGRVLSLSSVYRHP